MDDRCPLPDAPHTHHESQTANGSSRLVWVSHDAGIAQRRNLNRVLVGECLTQQQHSRIGKIAGGIKSIGDFTGVPTECADPIAVMPELCRPFRARRPLLRATPLRGSRELRCGSNLHGGLGYAGAG